MAISPKTLDCLKPREWLSDEAINGYAQLIQDAADPDVVIFNSFFTCQLSRGFQDVKKEWLKVSYPLHDSHQPMLHNPQKVGDRLHTGQLSKVIFPISEPVNVPEHDRNHWRMGVINCSCSEITYVNSKKTIGGFRDFQQVCHSFKDGDGDLE